MNPGPCDQNMIIVCKGNPKATQVITDFSQDSISLQIFHHLSLDMRKGFSEVLNANSKDSDQPAEIYGLIMTFAILHYDLQHPMIL